VRRRSFAIADSLLRLLIVNAVALSTLGAPPAALALPVDVVSERWAGSTAHSLSVLSAGNLNASRTSSKDVEPGTRTSPVVLAGGADASAELTAEQSKPDDFVEIHRASGEVARYPRLVAPRRRAAAAENRTGLVDRPAIWKMVVEARRGGPHDRVASAWAETPLFERGRLHFVLAAAPTQHWYFMLTVVSLFLVMDVAVLQLLPESTRTSAVLLMFWLLVGFAVGAEVWLRMGSLDGSRWLEGYALELVFCVDRVFVTYMVFAALETPRRLMNKALFIGLLGSVMIRWLFVLGLAPALEKLRIVPYCLGFWLLYCGARTLAQARHPAAAAVQGQIHGDSGAQDDDVTQSLLVRLLRHALGSRLGEFYDEEHEALLTVTKRKVVMTLLGAVLLSLFATDLFLSLDVALLKAELLGSAFLDFSSAVVAMFTIRAIFLFVRDIFHVFNLPRSTLGVILMFLGLADLAGRVTHVSAVGCASVSVAIVLVSIAWSMIPSTADVK